MIIKYGLMEKSTGKLLTYTSSHNDNADCAVDDTYTLSNFELDRVWMVDDKKTAALAKISTPWFNADYETPKHDFKQEDLTVVKITLDVEIDDEY